MFPRKPASKSKNNLTMELQISKHRTRTCNFAQEVTPNTFLYEGKSNLIIYSQIPKERAFNVMKNKKSKSTNFKYYFALFFVKIAATMVTVWHK